MRPTTYPTREENSERLVVLLPKDQKHAIFEASARRGLSVCQFARDVLTRAALDGGGDKPRAA
jgi:hypothetical protein